MLEGRELSVSEKATQELARRELSRRHLIPFVRRFIPNYEAGWVHEEIAARLEEFSEAVANKESPRLMIFMPPRHGKSELASRNFPAWHLGHHPDHEVIMTSYSASLALKFSRKVRTLLREPGYAQLFPNCQLDPATQALEAWQTTAGGGLMAAGVSGPLTGNGMHVGIIDDPVKNREEAESDNVRQSAKDWYTSTFYTRLAPGGGVLVILTRWHHDDLAGWLLEEQKEGGDKWDVVVFPAIAVEDERYRLAGDPLHPARYPIEALRKIQRAVGPRDWQALYQQNPTNDDGDFFKAEQFVGGTFEERPPLHEMTILSGWDLAIGQRQQNDWTVGIVAGLDCHNRIWVLDVYRGRWDGIEICEKIIESWLLWNYTHFGWEDGQISKALLPVLDAVIAEGNHWAFPYNPDLSQLKTGKSDKLARANVIQGRMRQGLCRFPLHEHWFSAFRAELLAFPSGKHDDQVDAFAWVGHLATRAVAPGPTKEKKKDGWLQKLLKGEIGNAKDSRDTTQLGA